MTEEEAKKIQEEIDKKRKDQEKEQMDVNGSVVEDKPEPMKSTKEVSIVFT